MVLNIGDVLNKWADYGVFTYVFPFLIIFAIVFAVLQKSGLFEKAGQGNQAKGINAVIAVSVGFLALLNGHVSSFFATIFPRFGIVLAIMFVILLLLGFAGGETTVGWLGWVLGIAVIIWAWSEWGDAFGQGFVFTNFLNDYFWGIVLLAGIGALIYWMVKGDSAAAPKAKPAGT
jgi:hypothetical protein